jgi:hypothetical protein
MYLLMNRQYSIYQWLVLATASIQLCLPGLATFRNDPKFNAGSGDPQITPAGYAFVVWGVITLLSIAYAVYQILPGNRGEPLYKKIALHLALVYTGFSLWLIAAITNWLWLTVMVFMGMYYFLWKAFDPIMEARHRFTLAQRILLFVQVGVYLGWTCVAIFANMASAFKFYGLSDSGSIGTGWQSALLIGASLNALYGIKKSKAAWPFVLTVCWAFVAVLVALLEETGTGILQLVTLVAIVITIVYFIYNRLIHNKHKAGFTLSLHHYNGPGK